MKKLLISIALTLMSVVSFGQKNEDQVYSMAEELPTFKYGMTGFYWFVSDNLNYPVNSLKNKIEGKVMVQFIVNKDGEVTDEKVVQGLNEELDEEALRVMQLCPNWTPGRLTKGGEPCNVRMVVPITFKVLTDEQKANNKKMREKLEKKYAKKN